MTTAYEFRLADIGEGLHQAEVLAWLVAEGDRVEVDQSLLVVLTDKSEAELPSPVAGRVTRRAVEVGELVEVGGLLVEIETAPSGTAPAETQGAAPVGEPVEPEQASAPGRRPKASPAVRRLAHERGIDLAGIVGSGDGGRILRSDLEAAGRPDEPPIRDRRTSGTGFSAPGLSAPGPSAGADDTATGATASPARTSPTPIRGTHPLRGVRRVSAETLAHAWATVPHIHTHDEADASGLLAAVERLDALSSVRVRPLTLMVAAVAHTLGRFPTANASLDPEAGTVTVHDRVDLGIATATDEGLLVPVLSGADQLGLEELAVRLDELIARARTRTSPRDELRGATATLTNYGALGGRFSTPIVVPPQALIVGVGAIRPRPLVVGDEVVARPTLPLSLGADHRIIDGDLLTAVAEHLLTVLADPLLLLLGEP